jgi:hypothetical protein
LRPQFAQELIDGADTVSRVEHSLPAVDKTHLVHTNDHMWNAQEGATMGQITGASSAQNGTCEEMDLSLLSDGVLE